MKRLGSLLAVVATISMVTACSNQEITTPILPVQNQPTVSAQSVQGLKTFYIALSDKVFALLDADHNKSLTLDEFSKRGTVTTTGTSSITPAAIQPEAVKTLFAKIDVNKNGRITVGEARANNEFLGLNKLQVRQIAAKPLFDYFDKNHNKIVTKDEFLGDSSVNNANNMANNSLTPLFYTADKNGNNSLTLTEFEDLAYALIRTSWDTSVTPPPAPVDPVQPSAAPSDPAAPVDPSQPDPAPADPGSGGSDQPVGSDPAQTDPAPVDQPAS